MFVCSPSRSLSQNEGSQVLILASQEEAQEKVSNEEGKDHKGKGNQRLRHHHLGNYRTPPCRGRQGPQLLILPTSTLPNYQPTLQKLRERVRERAAPGVPSPTLTKSPEEGPLLHARIRVVFWREAPPDHLRPKLPPPMRARSPTCAAGASSPVSMSGDISPAPRRCAVPVREPRRVLSLPPSAASSIEAPAPRVQAMPVEAQARAPRRSASASRGRGASSRGPPPSCRCPPS